MKLHIYNFELISNISYSKTALILFSLKKEISLILLFVALFRTLVKNFIDDFHGPSIFILKECGKMMLIEKGDSHFTKSSKKTTKK